LRDGPEGEPPGAWHADVSELRSERPAPRSGHVTTTKSRPRLSDDELRDLLALVEGADSVELKLTAKEV
jgi:hypothetical protein